MKTIYIVLDVELGWDNVIFASFNKEEAEKCKASRHGCGVLREELVRDKFEEDEDNYEVDGVYKSMRTLIIYNDIENPIKFLVVDGDMSRFNGVMVNAINGTGFEEEFCDWMFNQETGKMNNLGEWSEDVSVLESRGWDKVAICTFLP